MRLSSYLGSLNKEYAECEDNKKCSDKMSEEMKDNAKHIRSFILKLNQIDKIGTEEAAQKEAAIALAKEKAIELARQKIIEKKRKIKQDLFEKKVNQAKQKALVQKLNAVSESGGIGNKTAPHLQQSEYTNITS